MSNNLRLLQVQHSCAKAPGCSKQLMTNTCTWGVVEVIGRRKREGKILEILTVVAYRRAQMHLCRIEIVRKMIRKVESKGSQGRSNVSNYGMDICVSVSEKGKQK